MQAMAPAGDSARAVTLSPEQEERLRALGYVGGGAGAGRIDEPGLPDPRTHVGTYERLRQAMRARGPAAAPALAEVQTIVGADSGNPFARFVLGELAWHDGRLATAARALERAVALDPDRPAMRLVDAQVLRDLGRLDEAERQLRTAVEQTTADDDRTRMALAETLVARGRMDEARPLIAGALARSPRDVDAAAAQGRLLAAEGHEAEAVPWLERAVYGAEVDPWLDLGELYLHRGQPARAEEVARRALGRAPGHPWAMAIAGHALALEGHREEALAVLRKGVELRPLRPGAWLSLARGFDAAGERTEATRCRARAEQTRRD